MTWLDKHFNQFYDEAMEWIKNHKLSSLLLVVLVYFLLRPYFGVSPFSLFKAINYSESFDAAPLPSRLSFQQESAPTNQAKRIIVEETSMSLVVLKVKETADKIIDLAKANGGFMVSTTISQPEEAPFATVIVRIPADKVKGTIDEYRKLAVKVTSENVMGTDVTDQYVDLEARLKTLEATKSKFEEIMSRATQVQDILMVQRELISLQDQIDALKGRQKYLEQTASLSKITIYLSSDEMALPYAPSKAFRPAVVFKLAVRSLVNTARGLAEKGIWIIVYGVIWVPVLGGVLLFRRWKKSRMTS